MANVQLPRGISGSVNILGTNYGILFGNEKDHKQMGDSSGLCEIYEKNIYLNDFKTSNSNESEFVSNFPDFVRKVLRHEIAHAFVHETAFYTEDTAKEEVFVDWIAIQSFKIFKAMITAGAFNNKQLEEINRLTGLTTADIKKDNNAVETVFDDGFTSSSNEGRTYAELHEGRGYK